jgi:tetratricopeptide (TPR) repeat protein
MHATDRAAPLTSLRFARIALTGRFASMTRSEAEQIIRDCGGDHVRSISKRTTALVVGMYGWPLQRDGRPCPKIRRADELNARGGRIRVISERRFLELAGLREREPQIDKCYARDQVCRLLDIPPQRLLEYERLGLVRAERGRYDFQDIVSLRTLLDLLASGVDCATINRSLESLQRIIPAERPLAQLALIARGDEVAARVGGSMISPDGQLLMDFDATVHPSVPALALDLPSPRADWSAARWLAHACALEEEERYEEAAEACEAAFSLDPSAEALFNWGNALRGTGDLGAAAMKFARAARKDPTMVVAWYNLADVLEESGDVDGAVKALTKAVEADPMFADAHFNLASCLEVVGRNDQAVSHWRRYSQLDTGSEWSRIALEHAGERP